MIDSSRIVTIKISSSEYAFILSQAKLAEMGGKSNIRAETERVRMLEQDQIIGLIGEAALHKYWFGNLMHWREQRAWRNLVPAIGDGGADIAFTNIDIKTSHKTNGKSEFGYHLVVRPREMHKDNIYILGLAALPEDTGGPYVQLIGWASSGEFPESPEQSGLFAGAYVLRGYDLHPLLPIVWMWN